MTLFFPRLVKFMIANDHLTEEELSSYEMYIEHDEMNILNQRDTF